MSPDKVNKAKETEVWWRMYRPMKISVLSKTNRTKKTFKFKIGDHVRISHLRNIFSREHDPKVVWRNFPSIRKTLEGTNSCFQTQRLFKWRNQRQFLSIENCKKVDAREEDEFKVEKILKIRGHGRNKQFFVKCLHWPSKFNSWISSNNIKVLNW